MSDDWVSGNGAEPHKINGFEAAFGRIESEKTPASAATDRGRGRT